jgi:2'-5' RNA ligase
MCHGKYLTQPVFLMPPFEGTCPGKTATQWPTIGAVTRLSVAIRPPAEVVDALAALRRESARGVNWSLPEQWIVKLRPLGHVPDRLVEPLTDALAEELDGLPAARCVLGPATRRLGGQWLGAPVTGLDDLAAVVFEATVGLVPVTHPQPFEADVVLARGRVPADLAGRPVAAEWVADTVALVADRSAPRRPQLVDVATFTLAGS